MGQLRTQLENIEVEKLSLDQNIKAQAKGKQVRIAFRKGTYETYDPPELESQLAKLVKLLVAQNRHKYVKIMEDRNIRSVNDPREAVRESDREYLERLQSMVIVGNTGRNIVRFRTVGMRDFQCRISPGALETLSEREFVSEAEGAMHAGLRRVDQHAAELRLEIYRS